MANSNAVQVPQAAQAAPQVIERVLVTPFQQRQAAGLVSNRPKDAWYISGYTFPTTEERVVRISVTAEGIDALEKQGDISAQLAALCRSSFENNEKHRPRSSDDTTLPVPVEELIKQAYEAGLKEAKEAAAKDAKKASKKTTAAS